MEFVFLNVNKLKIIYYKSNSK